MRPLTRLLKTAVALVLCFGLLSAAVGCSSKKTPENPEADPNLNCVDFGGLDMEFKYSENCSKWDTVNPDSTIFRADGTYSAGDTETVYLHIKNHSDKAAVYSITLRNISDTDVGARFGYTSSVRSAFTDGKSAVSAVKNFYAVQSGYVKTAVLDPESVLTFALVINVPDSAAGGEMKLRLDFRAIPYSADSSSDSAIAENGRYSVFADCSTVVENSDTDSVITNGDASFKAVFKAGSVKQGTFLSAKVTPLSATDSEVSYSISFKADGEEYSGDVTVSLLAGYGLSCIEVSSGDQAITSEYDMYSGLAVFTAQSGNITVKNSGASDAVGVLVSGSNKPFPDFNSAIDFAASSVKTESVTFIVLGRAEYTVKSGEKIAFDQDNEYIKTVNVVGGNKTAEIFITKASDEVPSLPYASNGVKINYSNLTFDSENEMMAEIDYSHHFDYRGDADISFMGCTFLKALATRGPKSNVTVDHCIFKCDEYEDTLKGYCFYQIPKIGSDSITVTFTNNTVTENWGGINIDWTPADVLIKGNTFANLDCSKAAIQLSNAKTAVVESNSFSNIKNENALRFYKIYNAESTVITENYFDADFLLQSDVYGALNSLSSFVFENNTITAQTSLTVGHTPNGTADQTNEHGYTVSTETNTIK